MNYILFPSDAITVDLAGGKAGALADLHQTGLLIPPWFVVTANAFTDSLTDPQKQALQQSDDFRQIGSVLDAIAMAPAITKEIDMALQRLLLNGDKIAVRSSAVAEDSIEHSFAGQLDSFLFVSLEEVTQKVINVWRSAFSERVLAYRKEQGVTDSVQTPAVLIQRMINSEMSGVAFAVDPVTHDPNVCVIGAVYGLGSALVSGEVDSDTYRVDQDNVIIDKAIAEKRTAHKMDETAVEGVSNKSVAENKIKQAALSDDQILEVAALVRACSEHFQKPQDIEWAIEDGKLYLLQSRPITTLPARAQGELNIWDNSNIAESYGGITTPLTFSFARRVYEEVYRQFCRIMHVPKNKIDSHDRTFKRMLGLIRGRVYYNLLSWYRVLALLPGFASNRSFMEQMMGVKEGLPEEVVAGIGSSNWRERFVDRLRLVMTIFGLISNQFLLNFKIKQFYTRLNHVLALSREELEAMRLDELAVYYHDLENQLLRRWDAPLINDFFAMIFYGLLRKLTEKWCDDNDGTLQNNLICGEGGMISAEPAKRVCDMAVMASENKELIDILASADLKKIEQAMQDAPAFKQAYDSYLDKFGDRCLDELKLESETLHDDPIILIRSIAELARKYAAGNITATESKEDEIRQSAETTVKQHLSRHYFKSLIFNWVLKNARARVRDRENLRFDRTRLFGRVRQIFIAIGKHLQNADVIDTTRDIFYLELQEILGYIEGTACTTQLKSLIALRKNEFTEYNNMEAPADRFETRGAVHIDNLFTGTDSIQIDADSDHLKGIGCCPGIVRGPVRVITDPRNASLKPGDIMVAERTDPGWIMLFPSASALLVERGSLLSHSAIVAREMGIPAIVSISGVTRWLKDGDQVEMDGSTGIVRRIKEVQDE